MQIGTLAKLSRESAHTIRYYEKVGLIPRVARTTGGYRSYQPAVVERLRFIRQAQALSLSLTEIGELLSLIDAGQCPCRRAQQMLTYRLKELSRHIQQLAALKRRITSARRAYQHPAARNQRSLCPIIERLGG